MPRAVVSEGLPEEIHAEQDSARAIVHQRRNAGVERLCNALKTQTPKAAHRTTAVAETAEASRQPRAEKNP